VTVKYPAGMGDIAPPPHEYSVAPHVPTSSDRSHTPPLLDVVDELEEAAVLDDAVELDAVALEDALVADALDVDDAVEADVLELVVELEDVACAPPAPPALVVAPPMPPAPLVAPPAPPAPVVLADVDDVLVEAPPVPDEAVPLPDEVAPEDAA